MTTLMFCNADAGSFETCSEQLQDFQHYLQEHTGDEMILADIQTISDTELARAKRVLVMGGDGTVSKVLAKMANRTPRVPVGIIPAGTGNLLADCLGLKTEKTEDLIPRALETIKNGRVVSIDLGIANGTPFALDVAVGPLAMAVTIPDKEEKSAHGLLSYVRPLFRSMFEQPYRFHIEADSISCECEASAVFITNPQELTIGQKADVTTLRDGKLNLFILDPRNLDDYVGVAMRFGSWFLGNAETENVPYRIFEVSNVKIEAIEELPKPAILSGIVPMFDNDAGDPVDEDRQPATMLDGDVFGRAPLEVSILPRAVDVYVPLTTAA